MTRPPICPRAAHLAWLALLVSGCGLADYQGKMEEAQKRMLRHEEEERLLGPAIVIPMRDDGKGNKVPIANVHLRLPKGLANTTRNEASPHTRGSARLYEFGPAQPGGAGPVKSVELAVAGEQKEFLDDVKGRFGQASESAKKQKEVRPPGRDVLTFTAQELEDGNDVLLVFLHKAGKEQAALVYRVAKGQQKEAARAVELSLESFGLGEQAYKASAAAKGSPLKVPRK
jgi:hypothetical protein